MYKHVFFDLDGTLTNPRKGIARSYRHTVKKLMLEEPDEVEYDSFIGPPLHTVFSERFGLNEVETARAIQSYREYFGEKGMFENELYEGVEDMLRDLVKCGCNVSLVTTKPYIFAIKIVEHFGIRPWFRRIFGANLDGSMSEKTHLVRKALKEHGILNRSSVVMVGDRDLDVIGAKKNSIDAIGVLYGFGTEEELKEAGPDHLAADVSGLSRLLLE